MASLTGGVIQDQNLNVHFDGVSVGGKTNVSKVPRKGGLGGRKPLGDLSNSVKSSSNQAIKMQDSSFFSSTEKQTVVSKITFDSSKNKSISKPFEKAQKVGRKALTDISNSGRPGLKNTLKKNPSVKLSSAEEKTIHMNAIKEEGFLHNHQECIKARKTAMDMDEFLYTMGLDNDFSRKLTSPWAAATPVINDLKPENSLSFLELGETVELLLEEQSPQKHELHCKNDSPPPCRTPRMDCSHWKDHGSINFMLIETPKLPKH